MGDDLFSRMQEAAQDARISGTDAKFAVETRATEANEVSGVSPAETVEPAEPKAVELDGRLKATAARALDGSAESAEEVRGEVVEIIVDDKFGETLSAREKRTLTKNLKTALVDDPAFKREVDSMLLLAAREIGRSRG